MKIRIVAVAGLLITLTLPAFSQSPHRLLAYYPSWARYQTPAYTADKIPYAKVTHILHAFLLLSSAGDGSLDLASSDLDTAPLIAHAHAAGVPVIISIGGADSVQAAAFESIANNVAYRENFAQTLKNFVQSNGYDGADVDWEVPAQQSDWENCKLMMQALRAALPSPYLLSMAIPSDPSNGYGQYFDVHGLAPTLDFINVMTYDFHGPWTDHAGHNSPLILSAYDPGQEGSLRTSMDLFEGQYGVAAEKLNIGTAFYGYEFDTSNALWAKCGKGCATKTYSWNYFPYIKQRVNGLGWVRHYDPIAQEPYLLRGNPSVLFESLEEQDAIGDPGTRNGFITYDDAASSARKVKYVIGDRGLGGIFMWDLSGDYDGHSQELLNAMYNEFVKVNK